MGFSISWLGIQGVDKVVALDRLGLKETGELDEWNEAEFSVAESPTGWTVVFSNDFEFFLDESKLRLISKGCRAIACAIEEHVMVSVVLCAEDGALEWSVTHDAQEGIYDLSTAGTLPPYFTEIEMRLKGEQEKNGGAKADVDFVFDIPIALAEKVTGYRHDGSGFGSGTPQFSAAIPK